MSETMYLIERLRTGLQEGIDGKEVGKITHILAVPHTTQYYEARGNNTLKVVPLPSLLSTSILPLWETIIF